MSTRTGRKMQRELFDRWKWYRDHTTMTTQECTDRAVADILEREHR